MPKILIVDDDTLLSSTLRSYLDQEKYVVETADNGEDAIQLLSGFDYDVVVLDWTLPGISGEVVCNEYRKNGGQAPVIFLTGQNDINFLERGLSAGADDYLTKPFQLKELAARVRAVLRRNHGQKPDVLSFRDLEIDPQEFKVLKRGQEVHLLPKEFRLLEFLLRHPHQVYSADELLSAVWESDTEALLDTVRGHITRLRKKLDSAGKPSIIVTVYGVGYKLGDP